MRQRPARFSDEEQPSNDCDEVSRCGLLKIVGIAPCTSLWYFLLKRAAYSVSFSKQSLVKCLLHNTDCADGPSQSALVLLTCAIQVAHKVGSLGESKTANIPTRNVLTVISHASLPH